MSVPEPWAIRQAILDMLETVAELKVYDGWIPQYDQPPTIGGVVGAPVRPYAVFYPGPGRAYLDRLAGTGPSDLAWSGQVTVAAGYPADCLAAVGRVRAELTHQPLTLPSGKADPLREVTDPGGVREDADQKPSRFFVPLVFATVASS